jgi:hypothetical protein
MTGPRDWDKELADIDRAMDQQRSGPPGQTPAVVRSAPALPGAPAPRRSVALTWFWTLLAAALAVALAVWPYERTCGLRLSFFLAAAGLTLLAGFLGATASWANRRGLAHALSLAVVLWSLVAAAGEVLPRIGYAKESRTWLCTAATPAPASGTAPTQQPAPAPTPQ